MAVLGVQIVLTMITASIMSKVGPFKSAARWLLCSTGLIRYLHPSDSDLKPFAPPPPPHLKRRHHQKNNQQENAPASFNVPRNSAFQLETSRITLTDLVQLRFYSEYQWLIDFALYSLLVYSLTEVYFFLWPERAASELNLSMVWCVLVAGFSYWLLLNLAGIYFSGGDQISGERSLVIVMFFLYMFLAMSILIVKEETLETGLDVAYASFNRSAAAFLADNAGLDSSGPASKLVLKFFLALWCSSIGALFTFPGLRLARMQWDVLKYTESRPVIALLHLAFISPLLLTTLWVKPLSRDYLTNRIFKGMSEPLLTSNQFDTLRLYLIIGVIILRLSVMPRYLQSYLNMAYHKIEEMKLEAGKISNVDLQKRVARVFYYLCVVTLQYVAPMALILFLTLMYKTMGGGSWNGLWVVQEEKTPSPYFTLEEDALLFEENKKIASRIFDEKDVEAVSKQFSLAWHSFKQIFTTEFFRGLLGFSTWWCCLTWFTSAAIGITYQSYFANA